MKTAVKNAKGNEGHFKTGKKASGSKERPKGEWFLECGNLFTNESVAAALADRAIGDGESKSVAMQGSDGRKHDVFRIPSYLVRKFISAKQMDPLYRFKLFTRAAGSEGNIHPADFVEKKYESKKMLEAKKTAEELKVLKKSRQQKSISE